jgi:tRNA-5-methyluridine54 2-sulfurtransferase
MRCRECGEKSVYNKLCVKHFFEYVETTVKDTIKRFKLLKKSEKILVAISGGKDSQVLLVMLHALGYKPEGLLIDEGIDNYREFTLADTRKLCKKLDIKLKVISFKKEYGATLDAMLKKKKHKPCTLCGTFRRFVLNKYARGYDKIATGHNLDDEAQAILMNILSNHLNLLPRLGPMSGVEKHAGFVSRVKPLYLIKEKEVRLYAFLKKLHIAPNECPYVPESLRGRIREWMNDYENEHPGMKKNIIEWFLNNYKKILKNLGEKQAIKICESCGFPSYGGVCKACLLQEEI